MEHAEIITPKAKGTLMAHAGGRIVSEDEVRSAYTPECTRTHQPIPHGLFLDIVTEALKEQGFSVEQSEFALRKSASGEGGGDGAQLFALMELRNGRVNEDYSLVAGLRNSHDKSMSASVVLGSRVFVCDNMAFSGEIKFGRKHTPRILIDIQNIVRRNLTKLPAMRDLQERRIESYKGKIVTDQVAAHTIIKAMKENVLAPSKIKKVWNEWEKPRHEDFAPKNAWSLFNGFTEVLKEYNIQDLPRKTIKLHSIVDDICGLETSHG